MRNLVGHLQPQGHVLHNEHRYVTLAEMRARPLDQRRTLQLIYTDSLRIRDSRRRPEDKHSWNVIITSGAGDIEARITDPIFFHRLNTGYDPSPRCLLTMSLSMPYKPSHWGQDREAVCWKLAAGVIELPPRTSRSVS